VLFWKSPGFLSSSEELGKFGSERLLISENKLPSAEVEKAISTAIHGDALVVRVAAHVLQWQPDLHLFRAVNCALSDEWVAMT
jgi:hypothetical protein